MVSSNFNLRHCCPACGSEEFRTINKYLYSDVRIVSYITDSYRVDSDEFESVVDDAYYSILECQKCTLLFQGYVPSESFLPIIYDEYIDASGSLSNKKLTKEHSRLYLGDFALIQKLLGKTPDQIRILDYAAGWGNWIGLANQSGFKTYALELSEHRKEHLSSLGIQVIEETYLSNMVVDFVNCDQIFEHLTDPTTVLKLISSALSGDGLVRISVPHSFRPSKEVSLLNHGLRDGFKIPDILAPLEHLNYFNRRSLRAFAESAGFELIEPSLWDYVRTSNFGGDSISETIKTIIRPFYRKNFANIVFLKKVEIT
tara:strand:- start:14417 stop:15358 length:942 start_codon:yes stop_codon:yes gene_type:complete